MKLILSSLILVASTSAFSNIHMPSAFRISTRAFGVDPNIADQLNEYGDDAVGATFINCEEEEEECSIMEGNHDQDGWTFKEKGPANPADHKSKMLMMKMEDTE